MSSATVASAAAGPLFPRHKSTAACGMELYVCTGKFVVLLLPPRGNYVSRMGGSASPHTSLADAIRVHKTLVAHPHTCAEFVSEGRHASSGLMEKIGLDVRGMC